ncbi:MAG: 50S ribosomal protein L22 [Deltaproteobacteria bacterium]|nr:50S ribosomal protein L22 [Deltaproteobacteria bacterium]
MADVQAKLRHLRVAPRKVRLVADIVRGLNVQQAVDILTYTKKSAAKDISKLLRSAVASADQKGGMDVDNLVVKTIYVDQGPTLRRSLPRARGSASRINKKTSHVTVVLQER